MVKKASEAIWFNIPVEYEGTEYRLTAIIKRKGKGGWYYQGELQSLVANSIVIADLDKIKIKEC